MTIFYSILFVGFSIAIKTINIPADFEFAFVGIFKTTTILIWLFVSMKVLVISMDWAVNKITNPLLQKKTIPLFNNLGKIAIGLFGIYFIFLSWDISEAEDFQYFQLERSSTAAGLDTTVIIELIENTYEDFNVYSGTEYSYKLAAYDYAGNRSDFTEPVSAILLSIDPLGLIPNAFALHQNYPNPFNPSTQIRYDLPDNEFVSINIYDVKGRKIKSLINIYQEAGYRSITWDATNDLGQTVSAGMYIYTILAGEFRQTKKMVLLK